MTTRTPRRAVFAALLLSTDPTEMSVFGEAALTFTLPSVAALREWLTREGLDTPDLVTSETTRTDKDGRTYRHLCAYPDDWHGWEIFAYAREPLAAAPLDEPTTTGLSALAEPVSA